MRMQARFGYNLLGVSMGGKNATEELVLRLEGENVTKPCDGCGFGYIHVAQRDASYDSTRTAAYSHTRRLLRPHLSLMGCAVTAAVRTDWTHWLFGGKVRTVT